MSFLYAIVDLLLTALITLDTLGLVGQYRKKTSTTTEDYTRVCFTWIFYLTLKSLTPNDGEGYLRTFIRILFLLGKVFVTLPILNGTMIILKHAPSFISKGINFVKGKMGVKVKSFRGEDKGSSFPSKDSEIRSSGSSSIPKSDQLAEVPDDEN